MSRLLSRARPTAAAALTIPTAAVLALVLSGCGGGSAKVAAAPTTTAPSGRPNAAALQAFRTCMADQGETLPTQPPRPSTTLPAGSVDSNPGRGGGFGFGGGGANAAFNSTDPKMQAAVQACKNTLPAGFLDQIQQRRNQMAAFYSCMKGHGVTIDTTPPQPGTPRTTIDQTTPAYQICKAVLPTRPGATTTTAPSAGQ